MDTIFFRLNDNYFLNQKSNVVESINWVFDRTEPVMKTEEDLVGMTIGQVMLGDYVELNWTQQFHNFWNMAVEL